MVRFDFKDEEWSVFSQLASNLSASGCSVRGVAAHITAKRRCPTNGGFSNRAYWSSSIHCFVSVFFGIGSLIRVKLLFAVIIGPARLYRCMHVSDWSWSAQLSLAL